MERSRWLACVAHATCCQKTDSSCGLRSPGTSPKTKNGRKPTSIARTVAAKPMCIVTMQSSAKPRDPQGFPGAAATTRVLYELLGGGGHGQQPFVDLLDFWWRGQPLQYTCRVGVRLPLTLFSHSGVTDGRLKSVTQGQ